MCVRSCAQGKKYRGNITRAIGLRDCINHLFCAEWVPTADVPEAKNLARRVRNDQQRIGVAVEVNAAGSRIRKFTAAPLPASLNIPDALIMDQQQAAPVQQQAAPIQQQAAPVQQHQVVVHHQQAPAVHHHQQAGPAQQQDSDSDSDTERCTRCHFDIFDFVCDR